MITEYLNEVKTICDSISIDSITSLINAIENIKSNNGRIFFLGVGGSAANASHAVNDFRKILDIECYAVTDNVSELTARINDDGWPTSYASWLKTSNISSNDAIFIFSVGGGSNTVSYNLGFAINVARDAKAKILSIVSRDGGYCKLYSDVCVMIPIVNKDRITPHAEEWQAIIWHLIVTLIKAKQCG